MPTTAFARFRLMLGATILCGVTVACAGTKPELIEGLRLIFAREVSDQ